MADDVDDRTPEQEEALRQRDEREQEIGGDAFLRFLVRVMNGTPGGSMGITLHVGGTLVSGQLIGVTDYLDALAAEMDTASGDEPMRDALSSAFREFRTMVADEDTGADLPIAYVHIQNARVYGSDGIRQPAEGEGYLWRGRIECVDAFVLGQLGPVAA